MTSSDLQELQWLVYADYKQITGDHNTCRESYLES